MFEASSGVLVCGPCHKDYHDDHDDDDDDDDDEEEEEEEEEDDDDDDDDDDDADDDDDDDDDDLLNPFAAIQAKGPPERISFCWGICNQGFLHHCYPTRFRFRVCQDWHSLLIVLDHIEDSEPGGS